MTASIIDKNPIKIRLVNYFTRCRSWSCRICRIGCTFCGRYIIYKFSMSKNRKIVHKMHVNIFDYFLIFVLSHEKAYMNQHTGRSYIFQRVHSLNQISIRRIGIFYKGLLCVAANKYILWCDFQPYIRCLFHIYLRIDMGPGIFVQDMLDSKDIQCLVGTQLCIQQMKKNQKKEHYIYTIYIYIYIYIFITLRAS